MAVDNQPPVDATGLDPVTLARIQAIRQALGSGQPYQFQPTPPPPGSHPAQGFLDRFAVGLTQQPLQYQPLLGGNNQGANFAGSFLSALGNSFARGRAAPIAQYQNYQSEERQRMIDENKQAVAATIKARGDVDQEIARQAAAGLFNPPATPKTPEAFTIVDKNGKPVDPSSSDAYGTYGKWQADQIASREAKNKPQIAGAEDFAGDVITTTDGRKYLNTDRYQVGPERRAAMAFARENGIPALNQANSDAIDGIDTSRLNVAKIKAYVDGMLPKGAAARAADYAGIKLSALAQTDEKRSSFGSFRNSAIRLLRDTAGQKGLRINQAEILMAVANDIPQITDTYGTAIQKLENGLAQLNSVADPILTKDRSSLIQQASGGVKPKVVRDKNGNLVLQ